MAQIRIMHELKRFKFDEVFGPNDPNFPNETPYFWARSIDNKSGYDATLPQEVNKLLNQWAPET